MQNDFAAFPTHPQDIVQNNLGGSVAMTSCKWLQFRFPVAAAAFL